MENQLTDAANLLSWLRQRLAEIDAGRNEALKRRVIDCVATRTTISPGAGGRPMATVACAFGDGPAKRSTENGR
jgi:hypothetical protein